MVLDCLNIYNEDTVGTSVISVNVMLSIYAKLSSHVLVIREREWQ